MIWLKKSQNLGEVVVTGKQTVSPYFIQYANLKPLAKLQKMTVKQIDFASYVKISGKN